MEVLAGDMTVAIPGSVNDLEAWHAGTMPPEWYRPADHMTPIAMMFLDFLAETPEAAIMFEDWSGDTRLVEDLKALQQHCCDTIADGTKGWTPGQDYPWWKTNKEEGES
jgi:hypothetical protein